MRPAIQPLQQGRHQHNEHQGKLILHDEEYSQNIDVNTLKSGILELRNDMND
jgi:hypothetical protein